MIKLKIDESKKRKLDVKEEEEEEEEASVIIPAASVAEERLTSKSPAETTSTKKETKERKVKKKRVKGPSNPDENCYVVLPDGGHCGRSLTCKHHSMSLKRSVTGRSQDYDTLLRLHQARVKRDKESICGEATPSVAIEKSPPVSFQVMEGLVQPEDEVEQILHNIYCMPQPLAMPFVNNTRRRNCFRLHAMVLEATKRIS